MSESTASRPWRARTGSPSGRTCRTGAPDRSAPPRRRGHRARRCCWRRRSCPASATCCCGGRSAALITLGTFALLALVAYWQFPKDAAQPGTAWIAFCRAAGLRLVNLLYRTVLEMRRAAAASECRRSRRRSLQQLVRGAATRGGAAGCSASTGWPSRCLIFGINRLAVDAEVDFPLFTRSSNLHAARQLADGLFHPRWSIAR